MNVITLVVTYKRPLLLQKVLESINGQTILPSKLIIIDNGSGDETASVVRTFKQQNSLNIIYIDTCENLGGAGGFQFGFDYIKNNNLDYDYLWLMDDDLCPSSNCLEQLINIGNSYEDVGIIQPTRFDLDGGCAEISPVIYDLKNPFVINPKRKIVSDVYYANQHNEILDLAGIPFEGPLIKRQVVDSIGSPVADFFIFYDDLDYAIRAREKKFRVVLSIQAKALRLLRNNQSTDLMSWKGYFMIRNFLHLHIKHGENTFVKMKVFMYFIGFVFKFILERKYGKLSMLVHAFKDAYKLSNSSDHRP